MENYDLQENEVLLWKGNGDVNISVPEEKDTKLGHCEIFLTNQNIVLISKTKKLFQKEQVTVITYPTTDIKIYEDKPQVKQKNDIIEVYMLEADLIITVESFLVARKFVAEVFKLLTGKTTSERGATKFKGAVNLVDKALGIDTVNTIKGVVENGVVGTVFGGIGKKKRTVTSPEKNNGVISEVVGVAKDALSSNGTKPSQVKETATLSVDEQIEAVKKLKELLDAGVLTQEEFEAKKREVMKL